MRRLPLSIFIILTCHWLYAQTGNSLSFPSANNSFLGAAGGAAQAKTDIGVDLYTGTAQVTVALGNLASRELSIPVSLNYTGGRGIRVQDYAGFAGLGFQLNAGGGISRVVRGFPDEQPNGYLGTNLWGQQLVNGMFNGTGMPGAFTTTPPTADGEPDLFYVKTPFFAFQFTFDENGTPVFADTTGLQIIPHYFYNSPSYTVSSFEVIDDQGTQYYFGSSNLSIESTTTTLYGTSYTFPTTWYLDKIVTYNSKDIIKLNYIFAPISDTTYHYTGTATFNLQNNASSYDTTHPVMSVFSTSRYISSIVSSLGEMDFNYAFDRRDDIHAGRLTSMVMKGYNPQTQLNDLLLQTFNFNYSYFGDPSNDVNILRLRLDNITLAGNTPSTSSPVTLKTFSYFTGSSLPSRKSLSATDYWGYYNLVAPVQNYPFPNNIRNPYWSPTMANVLTAVKDMSGGTWNIGYELNDFYNSSTSGNTQVGGLRVNNITRTLPTGESLSTTYVYTDNTGKSTGQVFSPSYNIIGFIWGGVIEEILSESPSEFYDLNGNFTGYSSVKVVNQNGGYTISNFTNFSDYGDVLNYLNAANQNTVPDITSSISRAYKRGLLLSQTVYAASGSKISEDVNTYSALSTERKASWAFKWNTIGYNIGGLSGSNSCSSQYWSYVENFVLTGTVHKDYDQVTPGAFIQKSTALTYAANKRLVQTITSTDSKGANFVQTFYHADDAGIPFITSSEQTALNTMTAPGYNRTNVLVHQTDSRNSVAHSVHNVYSSIAGAAATNIYLSGTDIYTGNTRNKQQFFSYDPVTSNLISSNTTGGKPTSYLYGYNTSIPVAKALNALPTEIYYEGFEKFSTDTNFYIGNAHTGLFYYHVNYPVNFTLPDSKNYMIQWWNYSGGKWNFNQDTYTGSRTLTGPVDDIRIFPVDALMTSFTYLPLIGKSSEMDPSGKNTSYEYDGLGRQSAIRDQDKNLLKKFCYNYSGQAENCATTYVSTPLSRAFIPYCNPGVAPAVTYTVTAGKYTSSLSQSDADNQAQADMNNNGQNYATQNGVCNFLITLANNCTTNTPILFTFTDASNSANTYSGSFNGPGTTSILKLPPQATIYNIALSTKMFATSLYFIVNGQVQYGSNITFSNIGISGSITIIACNQYFYNTVQSVSFVRNNCTGGQHGTTVTYTVAANTYIAYTTQADANQLATNDVNANGQNYANAHGGCTFYYNAAQSQTFTRNNCTAGFVGSLVTYTVPANTYSATTSQADANQLATNDINANGQNYANANGTCTQFVNTAQSGTFTRNNCLTGQTGTAVTLSVPAGTYTSTISVADANSQAVAYINANGQAYANAHGTCYVSGVTLTNNSTLTIRPAVYFKTGTTIVTSLVFPLPVASTTFTTVPNGTYTVEIIIPRSNVSKRFTVNGVTMTGYDVTFPNVTVNLAQNTLITVTD